MKFSTELIFFTVLCAANRLVTCTKRGGVVIVGEKSAILCVAKRHGHVYCVRAGIVRGKVQLFYMKLRKKNSCIWIHDK